MRGVTRGGTVERVSTILVLGLEWNGSELAKFSNTSHCLKDIGSASGVGSEWSFKERKAAGENFGF